MRAITMAQWQTSSDHINAAAPSATLAVNSRAKAMRAAGLDVVGFDAGEPNFPTPTDVVRAAADACLDPKNYKYTPMSDLPELHEAIAAKMLHDSGCEVNADQVMMTNGGKQAVCESFQISLNSGDEIIIPAPYQASYPEVVKLAGGVPVKVFAGADVNFEPSLEALGAARTEHTKAVIVSSPNNPTEAAWKPETVEAIGRQIVEHHIWVISDKIYKHLSYDDTHTACIDATVPEYRGQLLVLNGAARAYAMPGWRVDWMAAPLEVVRATAKLQDHTTSDVASISQRTTLTAVASPLDEVHEVRKAFDAHRRAIVTALNDIEDVNCPTSADAFYILADITALLDKSLDPKGTVSDTSADFAAALLDEAHMAAAPGEAFSVPGYLRFSYALADEDLAEGMRQFKEWVN